MEPVKRNNTIKNGREETTTFMPRLVAVKKGEEKKN